MDAPKIKEQRERLAHMQIHKEKMADEVFSVLEKSVGWICFENYMTDPANNADINELYTEQLKKILTKHPIFQAGVGLQKKVVLVDRIQALLRM